MFRFFVVRLHPLSYTISTLFYGISNSRLSLQLSLVKYLILQVWMYLVILCDVKKPGSNPLFFRPNSAKCSLLSNLFLPQCSLLKETAISMDNVQQSNPRYVYISNYVRPVVFDGK